MAFFNQKFKVRSAVQAGSNPFKFIEDHTTSGNFYELLPLYKRLLIPGSKLNFSAEVYCRLNALNSVNYGRANFNCRAFFVPLRTAWFGWNEFINDSYAKGSASLIKSVPYITNDIINLVILSSGYSIQVNIGLPSNVPDNSYDFASAINTSTPNYRFYKFTDRGRKLYRILKSLGYEIFTSRLKTDSSGTTPTYTIQTPKYNFNALPLLALARVCYDWYYPSQYSNSLVDISNLFYRTGSYALTQLEFVEIIDLVSVAYTPDYFTGAFDRPNSPNNNAGESGVTIYTGDGYKSLNNTEADNEIVTNYDPNLIGGNIVEPHINTYSNSDGRSKIGQFTLDTLYALSSYLKRNQLSGSRVIDRYLSRYGYKLNSAQLERCIYLAGDTNPLQFGTVFSQSDSGDAIVGDYNGTGSFSQSKPSNFKCESGEDFGYFIVLGSFIPSIGYVQGVDRDVLYTSRFDFFTPEFDALGTQGISASELFSGGSPHDAIEDWDAIINSVFGFTPRYSEYKVGRDRVSGDFALNSKRAELRSYLMKRFFNQGSFVDGQGHANAEAIKHSLDFCMSADKSQYERIFYTTDKVEDHLRLVALFRSQIDAPMKQLYDVYDWDKHNEDGKDLVMDVNGAKLD